MKFVKHNEKSCCGSESYNYVLESALLKEHVIFFENAGFKVLKHFRRVGILQAIKNGLIITGPFGFTKLNAKCSNNGNECIKNWELLDSILTSI